LAKIVRVRTFIGLKQGITERVAAALQKFAMKVRQLGAGTGKAAERHRRGIREATLDAASAVPCWILPEWRVAEQLPSTLAAFDLVIIDEASQSDITSLPAVLRGKKLLVVGDDKQVSPSAVGMEERTVIQLRETFLRGMDIANFLEPTTSLYDLASMTFPGSVVMLREHFRCVEPIIAFSSRFYPKALIPLRVPTSEERLDPPLVDVFVPDGHKVKDVNSGEADFIAGEIARLAALPEYARRTFGVISMIGDKQAKFVQDRLVEAVGTEAIARHRIMCGNASTFQGQERDVIFLSLVACPKTARAQTARLMEQRFNVAMSRARDRMYLVRSVAASMLSPNDLKLAVIEHFRNPMADAVAARDKEVLDETESPFEHEVGGLLLDRGYRVRPQVRVGGYRIDFVVEGDGDRRLAVELDGDRYHGPERWFEDVHRQRALERLGWTFWRCWGSHWFADRQQCLDDLLAVLGRLGIEPVGGEMTPQIWTEHRVHGASADTDPETRIRPTLAEVIDVPDGTASTASVQNDRDVVVEVGDTVIVRFADDNRVMRFRLGAGPNSPDPGVVSSAQPIAQALLGNGLEEEVDLTVGGSDRRVIIEKITKAA
jgi:very-short-patch-repair endonuclease